MTDDKHHKTFRFDANRDDTGKAALLGKNFCVIEVQEGIFQCYKPVLVEDPKTGVQTETGSTVPFGKPLRPAEDGEPIILSMDNPKTGQPLELTPLDSTLRAGALASKNYEVKGR